MICEKCGNDEWIGEEMYPVKNHPNLEVKYKICSCGWEQEDIE